MAFDELELKRIDKHVGGLCRRKTRPEYREQLEFIYEVSGHDVSIYEIRPTWQDPTDKTRMGVARFKFVRSRGEWRLYWMRRDLKWHRYAEDVSTASALEPLVRVVAEDCWGAFFG